VTLRHRVLPRHEPEGTPPPTAPRPAGLRATPDRFHCGWGGVALGLFVLAAAGLALAWALGR
jgi:hypothetical protein